MGIPIIYFRSSSFNCHRFCPMQYFYEYVLGIRGPSNKKADKGTITHKVLEICALCKKAMQDGVDVIYDDEIGEVLTANYNPEYLNMIISRTYQYYTSKLKHHRWSNVDFKDCANWTWKTLKYQGGMFDPMNRKVVAAEPFFDFVIEKDWAEYNYPEYNLKGHLGIKGTVDLITDESEGDDKVYEILDYKTGKRLDWATGAVKDQRKLFNDAQLRIYHYAAKRMFPDVHTFIVTIFFINDGGAFTIHLQDEDLKYTEDIIRKRFELIKNTKEPRLIRQLDPKQGWKCKRLCHAGMNTFKDSHVQPIKETRNGQYCRYGQEMTRCEQIRYMIKRYGIDWVIKNYIHPEHAHGNYKMPGSTE